MEVHELGGVVFQIVFHVVRGWDRLVEVGLVLGDQHVKFIRVSKLGGHEVRDRFFKEG